ncbi:hypothetical protein [Aliiroseovarius marinus]|uniref:hypothetical protein n=1 Tax=Aliiroseovarius marinus TaxID=2500159 RepID=UPI001061FD88|nr:hypothetical protein [Aliiroseovarius marinus]
MYDVVREKPLALEPEWQVDEPTKGKFAKQAPVSVRLGRELALKNLQKRKQSGRAVKRPSLSAL